MRDTSVPATPRRRRRSRTWRIVVAVVGIVIIVKIALVRFPWMTGDRAALVANSTDASARATPAPRGDKSLSAFVSPAVLADTLRRVDRLGADVSQRGVLPGFGRKASSIVQQALVAAGNLSERDAVTLTEVIDGALEAFFRQQLHVLQEQAIDHYEELVAQRPNPYEAAMDAQRMFLDAAADIVRPGSDWSFEAEYSELVVWLKRSYGQDAEFVQMLGKHGQGKQVTIEVIRKLQQQFASIQRQADARGAFPWTVKWQYFMDKSPLGFRGQYAQGRSIVELLLTPSPDPRRKNDLLNRIGPLNVAVGFDLFV